MSVNLGPGSPNPVDRYITSRRSFLSLEQATSCAVNQKSPPPLVMWTHNEREKDQICHIFDFHSTTRGFGLLAFNVSLSQ